MLVTHNIHDMHKSAFISNTCNPVTTCACSSAKGRALTVVKLQEKRAQHEALEEALKDHGYDVTTLPTDVGQSGSQSQTTTDALANICIEHAIHWTCQQSYIQIA